MSKTAGILLPLCVAASVGLMPGESRAADSKTLALGKAVFETYCVICHGDKGDGKGLIGIVHRAQADGIVVHIYPRDFTAGLFKFRTTPTGYLPTDDDLMKIITEGIPRSGMPSHEDVTPAERKAVIEYIKTFSKRWQEEERGTPITLGETPKYVRSPASIDRGKKLFTLVGCDKCHGATGRGDGPSSSELKDAWGDKILPFDFTSGILKGGTGAEDIYRTFVTGLDGTPMPSYEESLSEEQRWDIVSYCLELMKGGHATAHK
jgi:cytochrome c oxidase cbb3-type subunit 2